MEEKPKKKARTNKPDWPLMFADRIIDLENGFMELTRRVDSIERTLAGLNAIPQPPAAEVVVVMSHETDVPHGD